MSKSKQSSSKTLKVKTSVKAGGGNSRYAVIWMNHNETQVRETKTAKTLKVKTNVKAGGGRWKFMWPNHNETQVREPKKARTLKVKTNVKAGLRGAPRYVNGWLGGLP